MSGGLETSPHSGKPHTISPWVVINHKSGPSIRLPDYLTIRRPQYARKPSVICMQWIPIRPLHS